MLIQAGRLAFAHIATQARAHGQTFETSAAAFDAWRHEQVKRACGASGLRACCNDDYLKVLAHFQDAIGETGQAMNTLLRAGKEPIRQLNVVLSHLLADADLPAEYAESIALDRWIWRASQSHNESDLSGRARSARVLSSVRQP